MSRKPVSQRVLAVTLLAADIAGLVAFFSVSYLIRFGAWPDALTGSLVWPVVLTLFSLYIVDVYHAADTQIAGMRAPARVLVGVGLGGLFTSTVAYVGGYWSTDPFFGRGVFAMALLLFAAWAAVWRLFLFRWTKQRVGEVRWLVLGAGEAARQLWADFRRSSMEGKAVFLSDAGSKSSPSDAASPAEPLPVVGTLADLPSWIGGRCSGIIVALSPPLSGSLVQQLMKFRFSGTPVYDLTDFYERFWLKVPVFHLQDGWSVFAHGFDLLHNPLGLRAKRALDLLASLMLLVILHPLMALIALAIRLDSPGPSLFRQKRNGEGGKTFTIYKFRTMYESSTEEGNMWTDTNDPRITRIGRFLRVTRLDELPQLINVLRGDMSFIGPRPECHVVAERLEREIPYYDLRGLLKPGISGWAQVMYGYASTVEDTREKLQYDLYYIKNYSLFLDIVIFFKTLRVICLGKGR